MSESKKSNNTSPDTKDAVRSSSERRLDGWKNIFTGLGQMGADKRMSAQLGAAPLFGEHELENIYRSGDIFKKICEQPAKDMTREWIRLRGFANATRVEDVLDRLRLKQKVREANTWARLHGGALLIIYAQETGRVRSLEQPLDPSRLVRVTGFQVINRWGVTVEQYNEDVRSPDFGEPLVYRIQGGSRGDGTYIPDRLIHASRTVRFDGTLTSSACKIYNNGWSEGIIPSIYSTVRDFNTAFDSAAHLMTDFSQGVVKIENLSEMLAADADGEVLRRLAIMDQGRSVARAIPLDSTEEFSRVATPTHGLPELLDRFAMRLSAASGIPITLLMGRSPAGQNATGESDMRQYYDRISAEQEDRLRPGLEYIVELIMSSRSGPTRGRIPRTWELAFNPLWQMTQAETVHMRREQAASDVAYIQSGVLTAKEVADNRFGRGRYSIETVLDPSVDRNNELQQNFSVLGSEATFSNQANQNEPNESPEESEESEE